MTKKKILHVDDDRLMTKSVAENIELYLNDYDYTVETAASYTDAIKKVKSQDFDLILLDVMMSVTEEEKQQNNDLEDDMSTGIVLRKAINEFFKDKETKPKLAYFTAKSLDKSEEKFVDKVISKPIVPEQYLRIIRNLLMIETVGTTTY